MGLLPEVEALKKEYGLGDQPTTAAAGSWWTPERVNQASAHLQQHAKLSPMGAHGLVSRWAGVEAGDGPGAINPTSKAYGIAQWLGPRKNGVPADFEGQLNHAVKELNGSESKAAHRLRNAQTAEDAAIGASMFERAAGYDPASGRDNYVDKTIHTMNRLGGPKATTPANSGTPFDYEAAMSGILGGKGAKSQAGMPGPTFPNGPSPTTPSKHVAVGDSIAAGLIWHGGITGKANKGVQRDFSRGATASVGSTPREILDNIKAMSDGSLRGQHIILSTGASNDPNSLDAVQSQIDTLRQKGATNITVLGVGPHAKLVGVNDRLAKIAKDNGVAFTGPLKTGRDQIHPAYWRSLAQSLPTAPSQSGGDSAFDYNKAINDLTGDQKTGGLPTEDQGQAAYRKLHPEDFSNPTQNPLPKNPTVTQPGVTPPDAMRDGADDETQTATKPVEQPVSPEQKALQDEFDAAKKTNPALTVDGFNAQKQAEYDRQKAEQPFALTGKNGENYLKMGEQGGLEADEVRVRNIAHDKGDFAIAKKVVGQDGKVSYSLRPDVGIAGARYGTDVKIEGDDGTEAAAKPQQRKIAQHQPTPQVHVPGQAPTTLKLSNGQNLEMMPGREGLEDGEYRYKDTDGGTFKFKPGQPLAVENPPPPADQFDINLLPEDQKSKTPPEIARGVWEWQIAGRFVDKFQIPKSDTLAFYETADAPGGKPRGFRNLETNADLGPDEYFAQGDKKTAPFAISPSELRQMQAFSQKRRSSLNDEVLKIFASGRDLSPAEEEYFKNNDVDPGKFVGTPEYDMAKVKGEVAKQDTERFVNEMKSGADTPTVREWSQRIQNYGLSPTDDFAVKTVAARKAGWIDEESMRKGLAGWSQVRAQAAAELRDDAIAQNKDNPIPGAKEAAIAKITEADIDKRLKELSDIALTPKERRTAIEMARARNESLGDVGAAYSLMAASALSGSAKILGGLSRIFGNMGDEGSRRQYIKFAKYAESVDTQIAETAKDGGYFAQGVKYGATTLGGLVPIIVLSSTRLGMIGSFAVNDAAQKYGSGGTGMQAFEAGKKGAEIGSVFTVATPVASWLMRGVFTKLAPNILGETASTADQAVSKGLLKGETAESRGILNKILPNFLSEESQQVLKDPKLLHDLREAIRLGETDLIEPDIRRLMIASKIVKEGVKYGIIAGGTGAVELGHGATGKEALQAIVQNVVMDAVMTHAADAGIAFDKALNLIKGKVYDVHTSLGVKTVSVEKDGSLQTWDVMPDEFKDGTFYAKDVTPKGEKPGKTAAIAKEKGVEDRQVENIDQNVKSAVATPSETQKPQTIDDIDPEVVKAARIQGLTDEQILHTAGTVDKMSEVAGLKPEKTPFVPTLTDEEKAQFGIPEKTVPETEKASSGTPEEQIAAREAAATPKVEESLLAESPHQTVYNGHGKLVPWSEIQDVEVNERGNATHEQFDEWAKKYDIKPDDKVIWVTPDRKMAASYGGSGVDRDAILAMSDEEFAKHLAENDAPVEFDGKEGVLIPESDDGDNGFLFVQKAPTAKPTTTAERFEAAKAAHSPIRSRIAAEKAGTQPEQRQNVSRATLTPMEKFEERKLGHLGYDEQSRGTLTTEQRRQILKDRIPKKDFFRKTPKQIEPVSLDKHVRVEHTVKGDRGTMQLLRNSHNKSRLKKLGYLYTDVNKKSVYVTAAPAGVSEGHIAGNFESLVHSIDQERRSQRPPSDRIGKPVIRTKAGYANSLTPAVASAGGIKVSTGKFGHKFNSGEMARLKGIPGVINNTSGISAEQMAMKMYESGYLHDLWESPEHISSDELLAAIEEDHYGERKHLSRADEDATGGINDQVENMINDQLRKDMLDNALDDKHASPEDLKAVSDIIDLLEDDTVVAIFDDLAFKGEITPENYQKLIRRGGQYNYDKSTIDRAIEFIQAGEKRQGESYADAETAPADEPQGNIAGGQTGETRQDEESIYQNEFDENAEAERQAILDEAAGRTRGEEAETAEDLSFDPEQIEKAGESKPSGMEDEFEAELAKLEAKKIEPAKQADRFDELANLLGFKAKDDEPEIMFAKELTSEQRQIYGEVKKIFKAALDEMTDTPETERMGKFLKQLNIRFTTDQIREMKPYILQFLEDQKPADDSESRIHEFSSTQVNLPSDTAKKAIALGEKLIPKDELYIDPKDPSYGREETPHITVRWGLHTENADEVKKILADEPTITAKLGKVLIFPGKDDTPYDVVKVDVVSPDLHRLYKLIGDNAETTTTFPTYQPHVTLAYVKKGEGAKYVGNTSLEGTELTFPAITFSSKTGEMVDIPLTKLEVPAFDPSKLEKHDNQQEITAGNDTKPVNPPAELEPLNRHVDKKTTDEFNITNIDKADKPAKITPELAGYKNDAEATKAYDKEGIKAVNETYEEFLQRKHCQGESSAPIEGERDRTFSIKGL